MCAISGRRIVLTLRGGLLGVQRCWRPRPLATSQVPIRVAQMEAAPRAASERWIGRLPFHEACIGSIPASAAAKCVRQMPVIATRVELAASPWTRLAGTRSMIGSRKATGRITGAASSHPNSFTSYYLSRHGPARPGTDGLFQCSDITMQARFATPGSGRRLRPACLPFHPG